MNRCPICRRDLDKVEDCADDACPAGPAYEYVEVWDNTNGNVKTFRDVTEDMYQEILDRYEDEPVTVVTQPVWK